MAAAAEVAAANVRWGEMMKTGNAKGLADMYTTDCKWLATDSPMIQGREALQKYIEEIQAKGCRGAKIITAEIQAGADDTVEGGTFWERGNYTFFKEGDAIMDVGKYVVIYKKVSGKLQLHIDIWNSDGQ